MKGLLSLLFIIFCQWVSAQQPYDVIITEMMADPAPQVGLPAYEWVEIRNRSALPVQLEGCRLGDASGWSGPLPAYVLEPDSLLILCSASAFPLLSSYGRTLPVPAFPSLDNEGDMILFRSSAGRTLHAVNYALAWYRSVLKEQGGWSLEMIDPGYPCTGVSNWTASVAVAGGTPGRSNSVLVSQPDTTAPALLHAFTRDSTQVVLVFSEPLDSASAADPSRYLLDGNLDILQAETLAPLFDRVLLKTHPPLSPATIYTLTAGQVRDCAGNSLSNNSTTRTGIPAHAQPGDMVINEILFDPRPGGFDYVEVYNNSKKIIDAHALSIANRTTSGAIGSVRACSVTPDYIYPGTYRVYTEEPGVLPLHYLVSDPGAVAEVTPFPSYPDDEGAVVLLNGQGTVVDEVHYDKDWHFKLITNPEGVSLERLAASYNSQHASSWHSAAATAGFGTPGYKNSQHELVQQGQGILSVSPKIVSPDNDGRDDRALIHYALPEPGWVANITLFNMAGNPVRYLVRNDLLGRSGIWHWDGLGSNGQRLPSGVYILFAELFNLAGRRQAHKETVILHHP